MVPYEAFLSEKPVLTTTDAGGPLEVVTDGQHRPRHRPGCRRARRRGRVAARASRTRRAPTGRPGGVLAARVTWDTCIETLLCVKVAYYSPMPPERSGIADYSAHLLPALRERIDVEVVRRGRTRPVRGTDLALYHVGNNPDAHGWIVDALRQATGRRRPARLRPPPPVAGLTIGRRDGHGYLDAMEREGGVVGRLLGHGVLDKRIPPLWESRPEDYHLAGEVLDLATGLIVHSRYVEERARAAGYEGPGLADPASRLGARADRAGAARGEPADRLVREREREQADPAAAGGVRTAAPRAAGGAAAARRRRLAGLRPRPASAAARPVR